MIPARFLTSSLLVWLCLLAGILPSKPAYQGSNRNMEQGMEAFRRKEFQKAEHFFRQAAKEDPGNASAHKWLGMSFAAREDYKAALIPLKQACELNPAEESACYYLGRAYFSLDRYTEAKDAFEISLKNDKSGGRPRLGLALVMEGLGRIKEAEQRYKEAIDAGEREALVSYGLFLFKNGRGEESLQVLKNANAPEEFERVRRSVSGARANAAKPSSVKSVKFDVSALDMVVKNGATGKKHLIETMIAGVAVLDYDNDGWLDIFVCNGAEIPSLKKVDPSYSNRLFRNQRDGRFVDVTLKAGLSGEGFSMGVATADFDNDGWTDLFVTGVRGNRLYRNGGNGTFADITDKAGLAGDRVWSVAAGWLDFDNDGRLDLFVVNYVQWDPASETFCGGRQPGFRSYCHPKYYRPLPDALYRNMGDGTFWDVSAESGIAAHLGKGMGTAFGDYDLDGLMDIFVGNDTVPNFLFHNEGKGRFREVALEKGVAYDSFAVPISSMGADFRDYDNDGFEDIFVAALTNETFPLFRNLGEGHFVDVSGPARIAAASLPWSGWGNGMRDFDNDGWKDLFTANGHAVDNVDMISSRQARQPNTLFINQKDGGFQIVTLQGEALHRGCAFGDLDRDGRMDIVVTRLNEAPVVLRNVTEGAGNWIRFLLRGVRGNRDAIGAYVEIETEAGKQWNRVTTCAGYGGSSERAVHFGLGNAPQVKRVKIRWPSGTIQELTNLEANRVHQITEP